MVGFLMSVLERSQGQRWYNSDNLACASTGGGQQLSPSAGQAKQEENGVRSLRALMMETV